MGTQAQLEKERPWQWPGIARRALPSPPRSPPESQFPICKMKRADPKVAGVQKYKQGPRPPRVCQSTPSHLAPLTEPVSRQPDFLQRKWSREGPGLDHELWGRGAVSIPGCPLPTPGEERHPLPSGAAVTMISVTGVVPVFPLLRCLSCARGTCPLPCPGLHPVTPVGANTKQGESPGAAGVRQEGD